MKIVSDPHLHMYSCFNQGLLLESLAGNLETVPQANAKCAFLLERTDSSFWADARTGRLVLAGTGMTAVAGNREDSVTIFRNGEPVLHLLPGRQVVTIERLEVLSLGTSKMVPDGATAEETIAQSGKEGGIPVLSWSPGKWWSSRGAVVRRIIEENNPDQLLFLCDTAIRPSMCREPSLMRLAREKGIQILAGSDPLPIPGEEKYAGSYCFSMEAPFDASRPLASVMQALRKPDLAVQPEGKRNSLAVAVYRWLKHRFIR